MKKLLTLAIMTAFIGMAIPMSTAQAHGHNRHSNKGHQSSSYHQHDKHQKHDSRKYAQRHKHYKKYQPKKKEHYKQTPHAVKIITIFGL